jgi:hypothetical protein
MMQSAPFPGADDFRPHFSLAINLLISAACLVVGLFALIAAYARRGK